MERAVAMSSSQNGLSKLNCFIRFDTATYWMSRTRDLIANAETYSYPAFRQSFLELRREARKSEMELVIALFKFEKAMKKQAADLDNE
jgi:hypothetical protein